MVTLSVEAQSRLEKYLQQVREYLAVCKTVDAAEVERDIREHIDEELAGRDEVSLNDLEGVLTQLGSPQQWVPPEEMSWWRKFVLRMRTGPEDWRLAYLSFGALVIGFLLPPSFIILVPASFLLSRAAIASREDQREANSQRWLIYPSLVIVYVFILFWLLFWISCVLFGAAEDIERGIRSDYPKFSADDSHYWVIAWSFIISFTSLWWLILGIIFRRWPMLLEKTFYPFVKKEKIKIKRSILIVIFVVFVLSTCLGILYWQ